MPKFWSNYGYRNKAKSLAYLYWVFLTSILNPKSVMQVLLNYCSINFETKNTILLSLLFQTSVKMYKEC
jgi:hypothetical protein